VVCIGQINDAPVNVGGVGNGNGLNVLTNNLNDAFVNAANITDINICRLNSPPPSRPS
jgi:hypothetical protein